MNAMQEALENLMWIKRNRRNKKHNASHKETREEGSPGYDQEAAFNDILSYDSNVYTYDWLSEHEKTKFDFLVTTEREMFFIDVVSCGNKGKSKRLYSNHKDFEMLYDYAKESKADGCYLAFCTDQDNLYNAKYWRILKIHKVMPLGDIYLSKSRARGLMTPTYLFSDKRDIKTIISDKVRNTYRLRAGKEHELMKWIYS